MVFDPCSFFSLVRQTDFADSQFTHTLQKEAGRGAAGESVVLTHGGRTDACPLFPATREGGRRAAGGAREKAAFIGLKSSWTIS